MDTRQTHTGRQTHDDSKLTLWRTSLDTDTTIQNSRCGELRPQAEQTHNDSKLTLWRTRFDHRQNKLTTILNSRCGELVDFTTDTTIQNSRCGELYMTQTQQFKTHAVENSI